MSVRTKLALTYAGFLIVAGTVLLTVVFLFLLRYVPDGAITADRFVPNQSDLVRAFTPAVSWAMLFLLVVGLLGGWFLAGRMLAPLNRISRVAQLTAQGNLDRRVAMPGRRDEFRDLADVFDTMLDRIQAQIAEQQRFAANASHELRTPLAITQTLLEVAEADPDRDVDALLSRLTQVNARAVELTEALLLLARADGQAFERRPVDLSLLVEEATENLLPLAEKRGIVLESMGTPTRVIGSDALLLQLLTNLMHNAIVHNVGPGGYVGVRVAAEPDAVVLTVGNTGHPISPELLSTLAEPFQRGAGRTRQTGREDADADPSVDHGGLGLGLAIAQSIARAHDAQLRFTARAEGGLMVDVRFPRAE
ncbi:HAMP domain-containing histidine kinase [Microbacterium sp. H1-D42]|nr:HAMP domain-containing sensor histidine kinase [Microbacterium sp. H1-D42]UNK72624.1 HAMP domain-containing histidine kinase [Microbacterium sp. H1-D42]